MDETMAERPGLARLVARSLGRCGLAVALLLGLAFLGACGRGSPADPDLRLVLFITVDQLRGDMPGRAAKDGREGGFRYLLERGAVFPDVHFGHESTQTATGNATLFTGADARYHGMVANEWADEFSGKRVYCVADPAHHLLGEDSGPNAGVSPANLDASTFGDVLIRTSVGESRVFSVSTKDRGAIIPAGQLGKAFWYSKATGHYVTSSYYYTEPPVWLDAFNGSSAAASYRGAVWDLGASRERYAALDRDQQAWERDIPGLGRTFPHRLADVDDGSFASALRFTPFADEMTVDLATVMLDEEGLGQGDAVDVLAVGLSAADYIGHAFGVESLEVEDNLIRLDRQIGRLLDHIDRRVGLERTLVVLSSDHGVAPTPDYLVELGGSAGRVDVAAMLDLVRDTLSDRFGLPETTLQGFYRPSLHLNRAALSSRGLDLGEVQDSLASALLSGVPGLAHAIPAHRLENPVSGSAGDLLERVRRGYHPVRSGDLILVAAPGWMLHAHADQFAGMHGTPYMYDTWIPLLIAGPGVVAGRFEERVDATRVAPTVAALIGIPAPDAATTPAIREVIASSD